MTYQPHPTTHTQPTQSVSDIDAAKNVMKMHGAVRQVSYNELGFTTAAAVKQAVHDAVSVRVARIVDEKLASFLNNDGLTKEANRKLDAAVNAMFSTTSAEMHGRLCKLTKTFEEELRKEFANYASAFIKENIVFTARVVPSTTRNPIPPP